MSKMLAYRALMPSHFTPRRTKTGQMETDQDGSRKWVATQLPAIRVFGAFWSFGFNVADISEAEPWPGEKIPALRGLRALTEETDSGAKNPPLDKPHYPTLLSAHVKSFLQVGPDPKGAVAKREFWESRMSLLAIRSIDPKRIDGNGQLLKFDADDFPVVNGAAVDGQPTLILAPIGDPPPRPDRTFKEDKKGDAKEADATTDQYLPAMQLIHGRVGFEPGKRYLETTRKALGLAPPSERIKGGNTIFLLPDGFALAGAIEIPWMGGEAVSGWFKVTFRWLDPREDRTLDGSVSAGAQPGPALKPWLDAPDLGPSHWNGIIARLETLLRSASKGDGAPRWLDLRPNGRLSADDLFWPLAYDGTDADPSILLHRPRKDRIVIDGAGLLARLADRPADQAPLATITIEPDAFVITGTSATGFRITSDTELSLATNVVVASYSYSRSSIGGPAKEALSVDSTDKKGNMLGRLELAVPMIETADTLRRAMGLPQGVSGEAAGALPSLWAFSPINEGWLHWPLPNATPGLLSQLVSDGVLPPQLAPSDNEAGDGISGALLFGNRAGDSTFTSSQRHWSLSIGEPRQGAMLVDVEVLPTGEAEYVAAQVELRELQLSFDGVIPLTPFRQTAERLLPDHAERALTTFGLRAVTPASLPKLEWDLWNTAGAPRFSVTIEKLQITPDTEDPSVGRAQVGGGLFWSVFTPKAPSFNRPWIWVRHSHLPTVQTLPLAAAGAARNQPFEGRSLAPFVYMKEGERLFYACKSGALDMSRATIALDPDVSDSVGAGAFRRPPGRGETVDYPWFDEIGMAVTTLPSITLFPGHASEQGIPLTNRWSDYPMSGPMAALARYDIALRDQFHALAVAPTKPDPGKDARPPLAVFTPLPLNAPYAADGATNGYDRVWTELSRKAGLAALDRREMLEANGSGANLVGVFGEMSYAVASVQLKDRPTVLRGPAPAQKILSIEQVGEWRLLGIERVEPDGIGFAGLPLGSDLVGLSGEFSRGNALITVEYGTAELEELDGAFTDQHGAEATRAKSPGKGAIVRDVHNLATTRKARLLTLARPVPLSGASDVSFWCADVPVGVGGGSFLKEYASSGATRLNGGSLDNDPFAGFRWTLVSQNGAMGVVVIDGMVFEPLMLTGLNTNEAGDALAFVEIEGRLLLPVGPSSVPRAGGSATLVLRANSAGRLEPELTGVDIVWPLAETAPSGGYVPTLSIPKLTGNYPVQGELRFGYAGAVYKLVVSLKKSTEEGELLSVLEKRPEGATTHPLGSVQMRALLVSVGRAKIEDNVLGLEKQHRAALGFDFRVGPTDARLSMLYEHFLVGNQHSSGSGARYHGFADLDVGVSTKATREPSEPGETKDALSFGADHFAFEWRLSEMGKTVLDGVSVMQGSGSVFATLVVDTRAGALTSWPVIRIVGVEEQSHLDLESWGDGGEQSSRLRLVRLRRPGEAAPRYRLFGSLLITNAFSWPELDLTAAGDQFEAADLVPDAAGRISHRAEIIFRGGVPVQSAAGAVSVSAEVAHTVEGTATGIRTWRAHQLVYLLPPAAFRSRLQLLAMPANNSPVILQKADAGFSPLVGEAGSPLTDYAAVPHFLHLAASGPGGIAGPLADGMLGALGSGEHAFLAVDLSAHLLLGDRSRRAGALSGSLLLSSLPAIGFCRPSETGVLPWANDAEVEAMLETRVSQPTSIVQSVTDGLRARMLPGLERAIASTLMARVEADRTRAGESVAEMLLAAGDGEPSHRAVFQAVVLRKENTTWHPAWDLPGAATAMHLSALLANIAAEQELVSLGFRPFGGITGDDLFPPVKSKDHPLVGRTEIDVGYYTLAMRRFRQRLVTDLIVGPELVSSRPDDALTPVVMRLVARSRDGDGLIVVVEQRDLIQEGQLEVILGRAPEWARLSLIRLAPWASVGMASILVDTDGTQLEWAGIIDSGRRVATIPSSPQPIGGIDMPAQRQREILARYDAPAGVLAGYQPLAAEPLLITSEPDWTYGEDAPDYRLSATGVGMAWSLHGVRGAVMGDVSSSDRDPQSSYWITDRYRIAFRPFSEGRKITFALPLPFGAELPGSLLPAHHTADVFAGSAWFSEGTGTAQAFAPAVVTTSRISSRPGAVASTRTGLVSVLDSAEDGRAIADASQTPLRARQPRPPILARNDRTRASSHEAGPFDLSRNPTSILHGPRAAAFGASALPTGLDRSPRSKFAARLVLQSPRAGIATPDWDGEVRIKAEAFFGDQEQAWNVGSAAITIGADRYAWSQVDTTLSARNQTIRLIDFRGRANATGFEQSAKDALRAAPSATWAVLEVTLAYRRPEGGNLIRQIRFDLLTAGAGLSVPGLEAPLFFRFDDPEYNDQLQGLAKLARENSPALAGEDFVFAADLSDVLPAQRLELALALRTTAVGGQVTEQFKSPNGLLTYQGRDVVMKIRRLRAGQPDAIPVGSYDPALIEGVVAETLNTPPRVWGQFRLTGAGRSVFHAMKLDCGLLRETDQSDEIALKPDDQLELEIVAGEWHVVTLRFDVVATPTIPANQSAFAILMLTPDADAVPVHLYAAGPDASVLELVDPLDLVEGVVRRRAIFQWRSFHDAEELDRRGSRQDAARFALQKINGSGGSWLPREIEGGWLAPPSQTG